ncbi:hypothetical protein BY458DRAFT_534825 [Sporodiniella umbellata]|nr:hypothetical protein BY458DRAFT_534825 [Sporodiniella umbellata]
MEEITKYLRMMLNRKGMKSTLAENERVGYRGKGSLDWGYDNVFIQSWLDGTEKYGFCYCLSDDTLGMLFNDRSTLTTHDAKLSPELEKKRFVLDQFKLYIKSNLAVNYNTPKATHPTGIHVIKYAVDKDAISFKLSNGVLQFNFFSHQKLVLYDGGRKLIFISENKQLSHFYTIDLLYSENWPVIECLKNVYQSLVLQNELHQEALRTERWKRYEKFSRTSQ